MVKRERPVKGCMCQAREQRMESKLQPCCSVERDWKSGGCERVESVFRDSVRMGKGTDVRINFKVDNRIVL